MMGTRFYIAMVCVCVSVTISIIAITLPYCYYKELSITIALVKLQMGQWKICTEHTADSRREEACEGSKQHLVSDYMQMTRGLQKIGLLLVAGAGLVGVLKLFTIQVNQTLPLLAGGLATVAGAVMITGTIVSDAKAADIQSGTCQARYTHAAFVSGVIAVVAGGLFFASKSH